MTSYSSTPTRSAARNTTTFSSSVGFSPSTPSSSSTTCCGRARSWIVSVPTSTGNGESGTVSANNYVKGDSAVVCALPLDEDEEIADKDKVYFQDLMTQSVPDNLWQNFKLVKKTPAGDASIPLA